MRRRGLPARAVRGLGYNVAVHGQKAFNGVALLSKLPFDEVAPGLIGDDGDVQARFLEALVSTKTGVLRVVSLYLPNGNPPDTDKYTYKLKWMDRLIAFSLERLKLEEPLVLAGDYNVIPTAADARNPAAWANDALFLPQTREKFRALTNLGLTDAIRAVSDARDLYTFWDYQAGAWQRTTASASTTCCCRRRPPTGWSMPASTGMCAPGTSRPTTCRSVSIWRYRRRGNADPLMSRASVRTAIYSRRVSSQRLR